MEGAAKVRKQPSFLSTIRCLKVASVNHTEDVRLCSAHTPEIWKSSSLRPIERKWLLRCRRGFSMAKHICAQTERFPPQRNICFGPIGVRFIMIKFAIRHPRETLDITHYQVPPAMS